MSLDAVTLALGDAVQATIATGGEVDAYTFSGVTGDLVSVALGAVNGFLSSAVQATVFSPSGTELGTVTSGTQPEFTLTETGTHLVQVFAVNYARTGTYGIGVESDSP